MAYLMSHQQIAKVMVVMPNEMRNAVAISFAHSRYDTNLSLFAVSARNGPGAGLAFTGTAASLIALI
jgi:hypothetical protein